MIQSTPEITEHALDAGHHLRALFIYPDRTRKQVSISTISLGTDALIAGIFGRRVPLAPLPTAPTCWASSGDWSKAFMDVP
jgi:hypothetical protein